MLLVNKREDVSYYELEVLDKNSEPVAFAAQQKIVEVSFRERKSLEIYIRERDKGTAFYVCSRSKLLSGKKQASSVSSKICSKIR